MSPTSMLDIGNVTASMGGRAVLHGVSFSVEAGEFVGLLGPNGTGKSTLLRAICGLVVTSGRIALQGTDIAAIPPAGRRATC